MFAMNRRELLKVVGMASTHALFPSVLSGLLSGKAQTEKELKFFNDKEFEVLTEMIDLIIPESSSSSSASATNTQYFIDEVLAVCISKQQQTSIKKGMAGFMEVFQQSSDKKLTLTELDRKAYRYETSALWFIAIKQFTLIGFFTSMEGETKASNYVPVPGEYQGDIHADNKTLNYGETSLRFYI